MKIKNKIREDANDKVQVFLDLNNLNNETWKRLRWGHFIVYTYLHTEEYLEEMVTFDDEKEAELYLQSVLDEWAADPDRDVDPLTQFADDLEPDDPFMEYLRIKDWDEPIRRGTHLNASRTIGLADARKFIDTLPLEMLKDMMEDFFYSNLIPGYYNES